MAHSEHADAAAPEGDRVTGKKIGMLLVLVFLIFFIVNSPSLAAQYIKNLEHLLDVVFHGFQRFLNSFHS
jgi:hypothetical protein